MINLLIADDHQILLDGFSSIFKSIDDIEVVCTAVNGADVLDKLKTNHVDVVLLDINMPELNGVQTCKKITSLYPDVKVIAITMIREPSYVKRMKAYGAKGYVLKDDSSDAIVEAIYSVYQGKEYYSDQLKEILFNSVFSNIPSTALSLTRREKEVLSLIAEGYSNKQIAAKLFISVHTVDSHRKNLLSKFNSKNTAELVKKAMERGML